MKGTQSGEGAIEAARQLLRQGLLSEAQEALRAVPPSAPDLDHAATQLLAGNIAYERGHYDAALQAWAGAADLYERLAPGGEGAQAAQRNVAMAGDRLDRLAAVEARVVAIRAGVAVVTLLAVAAVIVCWRRSVAGAAAQAATRR